MIIKSLRHFVRSSSSSVNYVFDGMPQKEEQQWVVFQNIETGFDRDSIINEFNENAQLLHKNLVRRKTMRYHEILAFAHENSVDLTREKLQVITHKYLSLRDPEHLCKAICVPHNEKHSHIHILLTSNAIGSSKSGDMMMTNKKYYDIRREMERWILMEYPELHHSTVYLSQEEINCLLPEKYKTERRMMELQKPEKIKKTAKEKVSVAIQKILEKSHSLSDFIERINQSNEYKAYFRRGILTGVIHENKKKYRFSNLGINLLKENFTVLSRMSELESIETKEKNVQRSIDR